MTKRTLAVALMTSCFLGTAPQVFAETPSPSTVQVTEVLGSSLAELPDFGSNFSSFDLPNGLQVVVIPDHRAPVVTHMIWYKVGAADEVSGESGIAHFLEHLMFKGTKAHPDGAFSKTVASIGGEENAFTSQDYTSYYQRVAKQHLGLMMELEADRMANLELREDQVTPELQVILEERASRIDNNPSALLGEALSAALYRNHPYGIPIIGWEHEMETLNRQKAIDFYNLYYTPNNAVLVVAGDVTEDEVRDLAQKTYGKVERRAEPGERLRPLEPPQRTARTVTLRHERVTQPSVRRSYMVPSDVTAKKGESVALDLLGYILGSGTNSRLYKALVVDQKVATSAGAYYQGGGLNDTSLVLYGSPTGDLTPEGLMDLMKAEIDRLITDGVSEEEIARAKRSLLSESFYAQDNQASLARIVGSSLTSGSSLDQIKSWPKRLAGVTADQVVEVAKAYLQEHRSVTGYLLPPQATKKAANLTTSPAEQKPAAEQSKDGDDAAPAGLPGPKAREMAKPKQPPRSAQKVPNPQSRPQGTPKPKPDVKQPEDQTEKPDLKPAVEG
ncbi:M16 family metallopeptidase [Cohaesibacter celericrescens]|uniref:Peptidase M16 n=1 Tax=Cohaesibacter celericrescens TaxID=2067669 RepID=A0A2N5XVB3_9HYPH|nr:pitrilysin family protein [Cohaesibacter celericrescens]PLW78453.1 peptidase M16 [Cohaesibacter celericrescens]